MQSLADFLGVGPITDHGRDPDPMPDPYDLSLSVKDFCRGVLTSREYRRSVIDRIALGTLPPAVECRMYDYAYGKPVERVELTTQEAPESLTAPQIRERIARMEQMLALFEDEESDVRQVH